jgi:hypothetical protein
VSEDEEPEVVAAFAALGGPLSIDELIWLLGSEEYHGALVRLATLSLDGDTALAGTVARDSLARGTEAVVLHNGLGLPAERAAEVMSITGAATSHLGRGMSSLRFRPE